MRGRVIRTTGSWHTVALRGDGEGAGRELVECRARGSLKQMGYRSTNPIAVGDWVDVELPEGKGAPGVIVGIEARRNYIIRRATNLSKESHILAANVDRALLMVTLCRPRTSLTFVDRFLASAEAYSIPVTLVFNKTDLLSGEQWGELEYVEGIYSGMGYEVVETALSEKRFKLKTKSEKLRTESEKLKLTPGTVTVVCGNSGVGKSTLINVLLGEERLKTAPISEAHGLGMHTTTYAEMVELPGGGYVIDTPGVKGFGSVDMEPEEIGSYFRDIFEIGRGCRFSNCSHINEPGCEVLRALEEHRLAPSRYGSYLSMRGDKEEGKYRMT